jgi:seryl-tRNA synthetase
MITTKYVRDNLESIRKSLVRRRSDYNIEEVLKLDSEWRRLKTETQALQEKRNKASMEVSALKKKGSNDEAEKMIMQLSEIKENIEENDAKVSKLESDIYRILLSLPNVLHDSVPYGADESENVEIKRYREPSKRISRNHEEIALNLGMLDIERAAKIAGARFYYLKGDLALLDLSVSRFALDFLASRGYTPVIPPFMMREDAYKGVTSLEDFDNVLYKVGGNEDGKDLKMIATSEHPIAAMYMDEILEKARLPIKYAGISPCFRMEAGTHGKDTKGIFRVHQFHKVEQFIFAKQDESWRLFDEMLANSEDIFKRLDIPYRLVNICTGDIGIVAAKKIDIEAYMPSQGTYREVVSCSNCTDWQSLRLNIRYDEDGERRFVHTLNSTAVATTRTIVAIIENYANDDGTITVPEALVPYMGKRIIGK